MKKKVRQMINKCYKMINILPFNNSYRIRKTKIVNQGKILYNCKIKSYGRNEIIFQKGGIIRNTTIYIHGDNNVVKIGEDTCINQGDIYIEDHNNCVTIGDRTNLCGKIHLACTEGREIKMGNDCLCSSEIVIRTGDSHSILDMSGERINPAEDVVIGDNVWIGHRVLINKGVVIPENTVIGTGTVVTKSFDESNIILAGVPAKVVKRNVNWCKERL
jgi:acetyltransferase-like isoleucine patch superfamily enzyme